MSNTIMQGDVTWSSDLVVGVVTSRFNREITEPLEAGAVARLEEAGLVKGNIVQIRVPGAFEIPLAARWLLEEGCAAVIGLGAVIRGETAHFDYVCQAVERGLTTLQLETGRPVVFGVLTTDDEEQARERIGGRHGHKGRDAAEVALEMLNLETKIRSLNPQNHKESLDDQLFR
ncbi:MAG: 6,7-dimethyl-8-ribityllumazine synthase [Bdellovibrionales bacterium]